jgi:hypothetical protein
MGRALPGYFSTAQVHNSVENHAHNFPDPRPSGLSAEVRRKVADCKYNLLHVNKGPNSGAGDAGKWGDVAPQGGHSTVPGLDGLDRRASSACWPRAVAD